MAYHALGRKAPSFAAFEQLSELPTYASLNAQGNAYRGDADQAFEWLQRAYTQRNAGLCQIECRAFFAQPLRGPTVAAVPEEEGTRRLSPR